MQHIKYNVHHSLNVVYQLWLNVDFLNVFNQILLNIKNKPEHVNTSFCRLGLINLLQIMIRIYVSNYGIIIYNHFTLVDNQYLITCLLH